MAILTAEGLSRTYPPPGWRLWAPRRTPQAALNDVSLTLSPGQRLGIVGESGSGKSTLLRLLLGLESPDQGQVRFGERPVVVGEPLQWYREHVQFVPQDPGSSLNPYLRVKDSIAEPLHCLRVEGSTQARVHTMLDAVGLDPRLGERYPGELSGGQRQRVAIARALAPSPQIIMADEPVSALDALARLHVLTTLRDVCTRSTVALVFVSHDLGAVAHLCDSVVILHQGRVVESGPLPATFARPNTLIAKALIAAVPPHPVMPALYSKESR